MMSVLMSILAMLRGACARVPRYASRSSHSAINCRCCNDPDRDGCLLRKATGGSGPGCRLPGAAGEQHS
jgi:hypothetical protein